MIVRTASTGMPPASFARKLESRSHEQFVVVVHGTARAGNYGGKRMSSPEFVTRPESEVPVVATTGVVVVGGGPAGVAAAVSAARNGAPVVLVERYPYLGGLASGGMVLILDDMHNDTEISVRGLAMEIIESHARQGAVRLSAGGRPRPLGPRDGSPLAPVVAVGGVRLPYPYEAPSHRLCRRLRPRRLQTDVARHGARGRRHSAPA